MTKTHIFELLIKGYLVISFYLYILMSFSTFLSQHGLQAHFSGISKENFETRELLSRFLLFGSIFFIISLFGFIISLHHEHKITIISGALLVYTIIFSSLLIGFYSKNVFVIDHINHLFGGLLIFILLLIIYIGLRLKQLWAVVSFQILLILVICSFLGFVITLISNYQCNYSSYHVSVINNDIIPKSTTLSTLFFSAAGTPINIFFGSQFFTTFTCKTTLFTLHPANVYALITQFIHLFIFIISTLLFHNMMIEKHKHTNT